MISPWALIPNLTLPRELFCKPGALAALEGLGGKRVALVTGGSSLKASGTLDRARQLLERGGGKVVMESVVAKEPSEPDVRPLAEQARQLEPDWIVGIGGGSVLDAAKAMWVWYEQPEVTLAAIAKPHSLPPLRKKARLALVPTTSGSGSECSPALTLNGAQGAKQVIVSRELTPDVAILDAQLAATMPPAVTAFTGIDAFTHAQEAYVSPLATTIVKTLAVSALRALLEFLPRAYAQGDDLEARERIHVAASLAGLAQASASTGLTHALAHALGARTGKPHGLLNAAFLVPVARFNAADGARGRYDALAKDLGLASADALIEEEGRLLEKLDLAGALSAVLPAASRNGDEALAAAALQDPCARTNPRRVNDAKALAGWLQTLGAS